MDQTMAQMPSKYKDSAIAYLYDGFVEDLERIGRIAYRLSTLIDFDRVSRVVELGAGSAIWALPMLLEYKSLYWVATDPYNYYAYRHPILFKHILNSNMHRAAYERLETYFGEDADATKQEIFQNFSINKEDLILFRHPDVKSNYKTIEKVIFNIMKNLYLNQNFIISTSNPLSLGLILNIIKSYINETSSISSFSHRHPEDWENHSMDFIINDIEQGNESMPCPIDMIVYTTKLIVAAGFEVNVIGPNLNNAREVIKGVKYNDAYQVVVTKMAY